MNDQVSNSADVEKVKTPNGVVDIANPVSKKWKELSSEKASNGQDVQKYLGYPLGKQSGVGSDRGGGYVQYFQRGMIVVDAKDTAAVVYGSIYVRYRDLGGLAGALGRPVEDEKDAPGGGRIAKFEKGDIYWHSKWGAHEVKGAIRDRYDHLKGPDGVLGYPSTGEGAVRRDGKEIGLFNRFANNGAIYASDKTGAWEVWGEIRACWENQYKGVNGPLGFPIAEQKTMPKGGMISGFGYNAPETIHGSFEKGALVWHDSGPYAGANLVTGLDIYVENFQASGKRSAAEELGIAGTNLYVKVVITTSTGQNQAFTLPPSGDYGGGKEIDQTIYSIPVVRGDLQFNVSFTGFDRITVGSDDNLGTISGVFDAQTLWGVGWVGSTWQSSFLATYTVKPHNPYNKAEFRQEMFWSFVNVGTPTLSWDEYAETYRDVSIAENDALGYIEHPFDHLFYTYVFEGLAASGNCFGMCLEAVYARVGRSLFAEPIVTYGWGTPEIQEINIKMGYQLGGDFIDWFLLQFLSGNTHDPNNVFYTSRAQFNGGDYPLISLTTDSLGSDGHVVVPYKWYEGDFPGKAGALVIAVANPDSPGVNFVWDGVHTAAVPDNDSSCLIVIDKAANTFRFVLAEGNQPVYAGGEWSGGRMFSIPFCQLSSEPRTPFWEIFALIAAATLIIFGGDAQTQQISDGSGKTFYEPNLKGLPEKWEDIRKDASQRIANLARVPYHSAGDSVSESSDASRDKKLEAVEKALTALGHVARPSSKPELYFLHGDGGALKHQITGKKAGASQWHMRAPGLCTVVTLASEEGKTDLIEVANAGSGVGSVAVATDAKGSARKAVVSMAAGSASAAPQFTVNNLTLAPGRPVTFGMSADGRGIVVQNAGPAVTFDLNLQLGSNALRTFKGVQLDAGRTGVLSVADGSSVAAAARVHLQMLDSPGGKVLKEMDL